MKFTKRFAFVIFTFVFAIAAAACGPLTPQKPRVPSQSSQGDNLTPSKIIKLKDLPKYNNSGQYEPKLSSPYPDTTAQKEKLAARIAEKKEDVENHENDPATYPDEPSPVVKIFANSDAEKIIDNMEKAALPKDKMVKLVDYLAGKDNPRDDAEIQRIVDTGTWQKNSDWSFFDDWTYYDKLKDKYDISEKDSDSDNLKRQNRLMMGKIFAIFEDKGDEFARVAVHELEYAVTVVESDKMAGSPRNTEKFKDYCKENLDYDILTYLLSFDKYYNSKASPGGLMDSVILYGYYYNYNRAGYNAQDDATFEDQLKYGHYKKFTDEEWLKYVKIQRDYYVNAYRYSDDFYKEFTGKHLDFQGKSEDVELNVYGIKLHNKISSTKELQNAKNHLSGQLAMNDWLWCYGGSGARMKEYNKANSENEDAKESNNPQVQAEGEFGMEIQQLKIAVYLLKNMKENQLSEALRGEVYAYSGDFVRSIQNNKKDAVLIEAGKKEVEHKEDSGVDVIAGVALKQGLAADSETGIPTPEQKEYAIGKLAALRNRMEDIYGTTDVEGKAKQAADVSWGKICAELQEALDYKYDDKPNWTDRKERLKDNVIKRKWECGTPLDVDECPNNKAGHVGEDKVYDTEWNTSKFLDKYEEIMRHMAGQHKVSFRILKPAVDKDSPYLRITSDGKITDSVTYRAGYKPEPANSPGLTMKYAEINQYYNLDSEALKDGITVESGKTFMDGIEDDPTILAWWNNKKRSEHSSVPFRKAYCVEETGSDAKTETYTYTYEFAGWFIDYNKMEYEFFGEDRVTFDIDLYSGYHVTKTPGAN